MTITDRVDTVNHMICMTRLSAWNMSTPTTPLPPPT